MRQQLAEWIKKMQETQLNNKIDPLFNELLNNIPVFKIYFRNQLCCRQAIFYLLQKIIFSPGVSEHISIMLR